MAEQRRKFEPEFREGAVRIVMETGKPIAQVARGMGVGEGTLGTWVSRARKAFGSAKSGGLSGSEGEELQRLRRQDAERLKQIKELEMERDVLKRCMVLWVK